MLIMTGHWLWTYASGCLRGIHWSPQQYLILFVTLSTSLPIAEDLLITRSLWSIDLSITTALSLTMDFSFAWSLCWFGIPFLSCTHHSSANGNIKVKSPLWTSQSVFTDKCVHLQATQELSSNHHHPVPFTAILSSWSSLVQSGCSTYSGINHHSEFLFS